MGKAYFIESTFQKSDAAGVGACGDNTEPQPLQLATRGTRALAVLNTTFLSRIQRTDGDIFSRLPGAAWAKDASDSTLTAKKSIMNFSDCVLVVVICGLVATRFHGESSAGGVAPIFKF